jgi:hypothetical protein
MTQFTHRCRTLMSLIGMLPTLLCDGMCFLFRCLRSRSALAAENLFLRMQLALYQERHVKPRHATNTTRMALIWLARWFDWRRALAVIQPATLIRWHRQGFRLFWRWTSQPGRPPISADLQALIRWMARDNPTWGEERIANELLLKLGLRVSPRTVRKYLPTSRNRPQKPGVPPPTLADLCAQSCQDNYRVRLLRGGDRNLSAFVCVCGHRTCHPSHPAHQRDSASQHAMDTATAACSDPV